MSFEQGDDAAEIGFEPPHLRDVALRAITDDIESQDDLSVFVGSNRGAFLDPDARPFLNICWPGVFFPVAWFLYRKLYVWAAASVLIPWVLLSLGTRVSGFGLCVSLSGAFGHRIYLRHAHRSIVAIRREAKDSDSARELIRAAGGASVPGAWVGGLITGLPLLIIFGVATMAALAHRVGVHVPTIVPTIAVPSARGAALAMAILPGLLLAIILLRLGRGRLSANVLVTAVLLGGMIAIIPASIDIVATLLMARAGIVATAVTKAFILAGTFEEAAKLLVALLIIRPFVRRQGLTVLVLATASAALGFALIENIGTVLKAAQTWEDVALRRALVAVPMHTLVGLYVGYGLARAEPRKGSAYAWAVGKVLVVAALLHGLYDLPLFFTEHAPLYPAPVQHLAAAFGLAAPNFLTAWFLIDIIFICTAATTSVIWIAGPHDPDADLDRVTPKRWLYSRALGLILVLAFGSASAVLFGLAQQANAVDALPDLVFPNVYAGVMAATLTLFLVLTFGWTRWAAVAGVICAQASVGLVVAGFLLFTETRHAVLASFLVESGQIATVNGDLDRAVQNESSALDLKPDLLPALVLRATIYDKQRRYDAAADDLTHALRQSPNDVPLYVLRSQELSNQHDLDVALRDLDRAMMIDPKSATVHEARFGIFMERNQLDDAEAEIKAEATLGPDTGSLHIQRAQLANKRGDSFHELAELDEAIRVDPVTDAAWTARGRLRFNKGNFNGAAADLAQAAARESDAYSLFWLYLARSRTGGHAYPEFAFWSQRISRTVWPGPIVELYLGIRPMPAVIRAARTNDERCEADFYSAEWLIQQDQFQFALGLLNTAAKICPTSYLELEAAQDEINRLKTFFAKVGAPAPPASAPPAAAANAVLTGDRCQASGTAAWTFVKADAGKGLPASLKIRVTIPAMVVDASLDLGQQKPGGNVQLLLDWVSKVLEIDKPGNATVQLPGGSSTILRFERPLSLMWGSYYRATIRPQYIHDLQTAASLDIPFKSKARGSCTLSLRLGLPEQAAIHDAETVWTSDASAKSP